MKIAAKMKKIAEAQARALSINPPPITFDVSSDKRKKRNDRKGDDDDDETRYVVFEIRLDPEGNSPEKVKRKLKVFDNGTPEEYCKCRMDYDDLVGNPAYSSPEAKANILQTLLRGKARDVFSSKLANYKDIGDDGDVLDDQIEHALNDVTCDVFAMKRAVSAQKSYLRSCPLIEQYTVKEWGKRAWRSISIFRCSPSMTGTMTRPKKNCPSTNSRTC